MHVTTVQRFSTPSADDRYLPNMAIPEYLDPGSASILLQMLGGGVVAVLVAGKLFWHRILVALHIRPSDPVPTPPGDHAADQPEPR